MTRDEIKEMLLTRDEIKEMLLASHNIILHGAPGTGKTYLAKEIATSLCGVSDIKELEKNGRFKMVQFHPSYDYTDFVEGLRPEDDGKGNIVFKRKDGAFKQFCKSAIKAPLISKQRQTNVSFDDVYSTLLTLISNGDIKQYETPRCGYLDIEITKDNRIKLSTQNGQPKYTIKEYLEYCFRYYIQNENETVSDTQIDSLVQEYTAKYKSKPTKGVDKTQYKWVINKLLEIAHNANSQSSTSSDKQPFLFLIDEINRGDLSKIFGELFYAIDPGYRGVEGKIDTQYQNLIPKDGDNDFKPDQADPFRDGFYIPENVYIIGTMNDIDRSVESMDFAMRRRFQFIEVTAEMSARNMEIPEDIKRRMENLNRSIVEDMKLSTSFQIGASYFLKLKDGKESADELWRYRLEGLLREYLRGEEDIDVKIERLKEAYNKPADNNTAHETNNVI